MSVIDSFSNSVFWHRKCRGVKKRAGKIGAKTPFFNPQFKLQLPNEGSNKNKQGGFKI